MPRAHNQDILIDTAAGNPVDNVQGAQLSIALAGSYFDTLIKGPSIKRTEPDPRYNCHGLTFASRRARILDDVHIHRILNDDGYRELSAANALPGDVAIYFDNAGQIEHSGIVVSPPSTILSVPTVCSKWGELGEVVHLATSCPLYAINNIRYYRVTR